MFEELGVVGFREVASGMDAAAFSPIEGGLRDKQADGEHILELPALGIDELFIHNVSLPELNHIYGLF